MGISRMQKVRLLGHREFREEIVKEIQELGLMQIEDLRISLKDSSYEELLLPEEIKEEKLERKRQELGAVLKFLESFQKRSLVESFLPAKVNLTPEDFQAILKNFRHEEIAEAARKLEKGIKELESQRQRLLREIEELIPWKQLELPLGKIKDTQETIIILGIISRINFQVLEEKLKEAHPESFLESVDENKTQVHCLLVFHKAHQEAISSLFKELSFTAISLPLFEEEPQEMLKNISGRLEEIKTEQEILRQKSRELLGELPRLAAVYDYLSNLKERKYLKNFCAHTQETFFLNGWLRKRDFKHFKESLSGKFSELDITPIEARAGEDPPVDLRNKKIVEPFEVITGLYSFPRSSEFDPTPFMAPFFFVFFGLCITDVGYGILLILLSLWGMKKIKAGAKFFRLIFLGGIATVLAGVFTGGWFGIELANLPAPLQKVVLFSPLDEPMVFFQLALALGFIQICFGTLIKLIRDIKDKDWVATFFSEGAWIVIFMGVLCFILGENFLGGKGLLLGKWLFIGGCFARVIIGGLFKKNKIAGVGIALVLLLDGLKNLLGNVLSYARLMALGLATGVIAMAINIIASLVREIPVVGWVVMIMILVGGHVFNLLINTLGGFVHTARLQYVEFFPYFFEGGGEPFTPFEVKNEYIVIDK